MRRYAEGAAALLLLLVWGAASAAEIAPGKDDGIPALLKFAEQQQAVPVVESAPAAPQPVTAKPKPAAVTRGDNARLTALNQALQRQAETIRQLEQQLAAQAQPAAPAPRQHPNQTRLISGRW